MAQFEGCEYQHICRKMLKSFTKISFILRHFAMSPKSTELLNNALDVLKMSSVHVLNWDSTRMTGFLDACIQASSIIVPFLDTIVTGKIWFSWQAHKESSFNFLQTYTQFSLKNICLMLTRIMFWCAESTGLFTKLLLCWVMQTSSKCLLRNSAFWPLHQN